MDEVLQEFKELVTDANDSGYLKTEYFAFVAGRVVQRLVGSSTFAAPAYNSTFFNESKRKRLVTLSDKAFALLNVQDANKCAESTCQFLSMAAFSVHEQDDAFYYMLMGAIQDILSKLTEPATSNSSKDIVLWKRRYLAVKGATSKALTVFHTPHW